MSVLCASTKNAFPYLCGRAWKPWQAIQELLPPWHTPGPTQGPTVTMVDVGSHLGVFCGGGAAHARSYLESCHLGSRHQEPLKALQQWQWTPGATWGPAVVADIGSHLGPFHSGGHCELFWDMLLQELGANPGSEQLPDTAATRLQVAGLEMGGGGQIHSNTSSSVPYFEFNLWVNNITR